MTADRAPVRRSPVSAPGVTGILQRQCACENSNHQCEDCRKKAALRRHAEGGGLEPVPLIVHEVLRSSGQPLDASTRAFMEARFGHDFTRVRVHTDARAGESARAVNAQAYTVGSHVVFKGGHYAPRTKPGRDLLAHELAHTFQQEHAAELLPAAISSPGDAGEQEADRICRLVMADSPGGAPDETAVVRAPVPRLTARVQRQAADAPARSQTAGGSPPPATADACVKPLQARNLEDVFRLDTVTIVQLSASWCHEPCEMMRASMNELCEKSRANPHPFRVQAFFVDVDPLDANGEPVQSEEASQNRALGVRHGACEVVRGDHKCRVPQPLMFVERRLVEDGKKIASVEAFEKRAAEVISGAPTSGVFQGMKWGGIVGGIVGGVVGTIAGAVAGGVGGALLGGFLGSAAGSALGLGLGAIFGEAFGKDRGTSPLSKARLEQVQAFQRGDLPENQVDDDLARDVANYFAGFHDKGFDLSPDQRRVLIKAMIEGTTGDADERAIIKILENSSDADLLQIFAADKELRLTDLLPEFDGEERDYLVALLERLKGRFPTSAEVGELTGLLIDRADVKVILTKAFTETHKPGPAGAQVFRECCGILMETQNGSIVSKDFCGEGTACPAPALGQLTARTEPPTHRILGSYHTHPNVPAEGKPREAPSRADFATFVQTAPFEGWEHYVVGPFNIYLILWDGSFRVLGNTPGILGVPAIPIPPGTGSTLELR
jgi:hypothetical protein